MATQAKVSGKKSKKRKSMESMSAEPLPPAAPAAPYSTSTSPQKTSAAVITNVGGTNAPVTMSLAHQRPRSSPVIIEDHHHQQQPQPSVATVEMTTSAVLHHQASKSVGTSTSVAAASAAINSPYLPQQQNNQPEYYNLVPTNKLRNSSRSRQPSQWSLDQQDETVAFMDDGYGNEALMGYTVDLSNAPLPPPPPQTCPGGDGMCMLGSCPQDMIDTSGLLPPTNGGGGGGGLVRNSSNSYMPVQPRLSRQYSASIEALD